MENLFRITSNIELTTYILGLDKFEIQELVQYTLKTISEYHNNNYNIDIQIHKTLLIQILQKIDKKKETIKKLKFNRKLILRFSAAEFIAIRKLLKSASFDEMPLQHSILMQLDK